MAKKVLTLLLPILLCVAGVIGILLLTLPAKEVTDSPAFKYGIVLDAGSSHTALFIYKWPADKENETGIVSQHTMCDVEGPGISSYFKDPPQAGKSLETCLDQAVKDVPANRHSITPIYLGATAGMRLLNWTNPSASDKVLEEVSSTLKSYPFDFRGARILSGQDEGIYGWVTANYLQETLIKYGWFGSWFQPRKGTLGAMDLGGASTQITFETSAKIENPESEMTLRLYGQTYRVYTHSFLCYGRDQVLKRILSKVLKSQSHATTVQNPCWPKDYTTPLTFGDVYESPCTASEKPPNYNPSTPITMTGSGNAAQCSPLVDSLFEFSGCTFTSCSFDHIFQPEVTGKFIAFAAFFYTVDFIKSVLKMPVATLEDLNKAATALCSFTINELEAKSPESEKKHLNGYCGMTSFLYLLLSKGYRFNEETFPNIAFQKKAGDTSIGWALGYMLNLTNMIPAEQPPMYKAMKVSAWSALIFLFVLVIFLSFIIICGTARSKKQQQNI